MRLIMLLFSPHIWASADWREVDNLIIKGVFIKKIIWPKCRILGTKIYLRGDTIERISYIGKWKVGLHIMQCIIVIHLRRDKVRSALHHTNVVTLQPGRKFTYEVKHSLKASCSLVLLENAKRCIWRISVMFFFLNMFSPNLINPNC